MGLTPRYRVHANSQDITETVRQRLVSMRITDEAGMKSDVLELVLADNDPGHRIAEPPMGAELEAWMGYDERLVYMGLYVVDEIELSGSPDTVTIRARASTHDETPAGLTRLNTQRTRSWDNVTLGDIATRIATEHKLRPAVASSLASIELGHVDQTEESDMSLLTRLAHHYDAVAKPAAGRLVVAPAGSAKSASGKSLAAASVTLHECSTWRVTGAARGAGGTVIARWYSRAEGKEIEVQSGSGQPIRRLRHLYPDHAKAQAAATAEYQRRIRGKRTLSITLTGRTDLQAEAPLLITGARDGVAGPWHIKHVEHALDGSGYVCTLDAEIGAVK